MPTIRDDKNIMSLTWKADCNMEGGNSVRFYELTDVPTWDTFAGLALVHYTQFQVVVFSQNLSIGHLVDYFATVPGICLVGSGEKTSNTWQFNCMRDTKPLEAQDAPFSDVLSFLKDLRLINLDTTENDLADSSNIYYASPNEIARMQLDDPPASGHNG